MSQPVGVALALGTTVFWSISPLAMSKAGRMIGSSRLNALRLAISAGVLALVVLLSLALPGWNPSYPGANSCAWIIASGLAGLVIGDNFYYASLVSLGPRRAALIVTLSPVFAVVASWVWLDETLPPLVLAGIALAIGAVAYAVDLERRTHRPGGAEPGSVSARGVVDGLAAALCAGLAAVLLRKAYLTQPQMDSLAATAVRVSAAAAMIWLVPIVRGPRPLLELLRTPGLMRPLLIGTAAGPLLGMLCYVAAFKYAQAGLVNTLASMTPIMLIPIAAVVYRTRIRKRAVLATVLALVGVAMMFTGR